MKLKELTEFILNRDEDTITIKTRSDEILWRGEPKNFTFAPCTDRIVVGISRDGTITVV